MMGSKNEHLDFMHNSAFPMSQQDNLTFNTPTQMPAGAQNVASQYEVSTNPLTGEPTAKFAEGGTVGGPVAWFGQSLNNPNSPLGQAFQAHLGASGKASMPPPPFDPNTQAAHFDPSAFKVSVTSPSIAKPYTPKYAAGGELLKGPGDGVSDDIPATIGGRQPAKLSEGEFVVPARIVSELGNGSTDAGAKRLYAMMDRIQKQRGKTMGKKGFSKDSRAERALPV
jgi:hypothetical protein